MVAHAWKLGNVVISVVIEINQSTMIDFIQFIDHNFTFKLVHVTEQVQNVTNCLTDVHYPQHKNAIMVERVQQMAVISTVHAQLVFLDLIVNLKRTIAFQINV